MMEGDNMLRYAMILAPMALLACAYGTHEKPKQEIKTVKKK